MKIGVFFSGDNGIISKTVDVDALAESLSDVQVTRVYDSFFSYASQQDMLETVDGNDLDGIVFAGNSPKYFEKVINGTLILDALKSRGINENRIAFANIKEQVALPHAGESEKATKKARILINVALAKLEMAREIKMESVAPRRAVLVIGTTAGGIIAARELLEKGYRVYIIEKESSIRDQAKMDHILPTLAAVQADSKATMLFETNVKDVSGWCGDYPVLLSTQRGEEEIAVGGILLAAGDDREWIKDLRPKMQLDIDDEGFIRVQQVSDLAGRTRDSGIWFIPPAKGDNPVMEEISAASTAVLSLITILDKNEIQHPVLVSEVDENVCGGCGTCVKTCAFSASSLDPIRKVSVIDTKRCKGCGNCVSACPTGARDLMTFPQKHIVRAIKIMGQTSPDDSEPKVLAMLCNGGGYSAADSAGELSSQMEELKYSTNVMPLRVECGGSIDTQHILEAFREGFDGIAITVCQSGHCHNIVGNTDMQRRLGLFREVLRSRNINDNRLRIINILSHEGKEFSEEIKTFCDELKALKTTCEESRPANTLGGKQLA